MKSVTGVIREKFSSKKIVIVGDIVADQFLHGTIARVSREAPVFILRHDETETLAGGAANAAVNVTSLGGEAILVGVIGEDADGYALLKELKKQKINCDFIVSGKNYRTTTKVRVLAGQHYAPRQQVIRIDYENGKALDKQLEDKLKKNLLAASQSADAVIVSDYNYGVANQGIAEIVNKIAKNKKVPVLVDSRFNLTNFKNATTATPNQDEIEQILGKNFTEADCAELCKSLKFEALLVTRGNKGMILFEKDKSPVYLKAIGAKEPIDVTGAGDTVIAAYALGLTSGLNFSDAAKIANHAGGIVVMKKGTASVSTKELLASLAKNQKAKHKV